MLKRTVAQVLDEPLAAADRQLVTLELDAP